MCLFSVFRPLRLFNFVFTSPGISGCNPKNSSPAVQEKLCRVSVKNTRGFPESKFLILFSCIYFLLAILMPCSGQKSKTNLIETGNPWSMHIDTIHAFEVEVPGKLEEKRNLITRGKITPGWKVRTFTCTDHSTGIFYLVTVTEPGNDQYIFNDSLYLVSVRENQAENLTKRTVDTILRRNGVITYLQSGKSPVGNIFLKSMATVRNNRVVTAVTGYQKAMENSDDMNRFMESFKLLDLKTIPFQKYDFASNAYETMGPAPFQFFLDTVSAAYPISTYNSRDSLSSNVFSAIIVPAADKQWYRNAGEYWEEKLGLMTDKEDTLIAQRPVSNGAAEGYQVVLESGRLHKHIRMLPFADSLLILVTVTPPHEVLSEDKLDFFENFRFKGNYQKPVLFKSRANELLNDLASSDSSVFNDALLRMDEAPFSIADIPVLRKALLLHYPLSTYSTQYSQTPTEKISDALLKLGDPSIASYVMKDYHREHGRNWMEQSLLLNLIANVPKEETYRFITNELLSVPKDTVVAEDVFFTLCNDLDVLTDFFPDLLPLIENKYMQNGMLAVINNLLQSDSILPGAIRKFEPTLLTIFENNLVEYQREPSDEFYNRHYRAMTIAGKLKSEKAREILLRSAEIYTGGLRKVAALELLGMGTKADAGIWESLAADNEFRYDLYTDLKTMEQLTVFPVKYAKQTLMAESVMWTHAMEEANPLEINALTQRKTSVEDAPATVYFFVIQFRTDSGEKSPRLGMVVFPANTKDLEVVEGYFAVDWETPYQSKEKEKRITEMMGWLEKQE
jgi:hypothetical protein